MENKENWKTFTFKQENGVLIKNRMRESITHSSPLPPSRETRSSNPKSPGKNKEDGSQWAIIAGGALAAAATMIGRKRSKSPVAVRNAEAINENPFLNQPVVDFTRPISRSGSACRCSNSSPMNTSPEMSPKSFSKNLKNSRNLNKTSDSSYLEEGFVFTSESPSLLRLHPPSKPSNNDLHQKQQLHNHQRHHSQSSFPSTPSSHPLHPNPLSPSSPAPPYRTKFKQQQQQEEEGEDSHGHGFHSTIEEAFRTSHTFPETSSSIHEDFHPSERVTDMVINTKKTPIHSTSSLAPSPSPSPFSISSFASPSKDTIQKLRTQLKSRDELILEMQLQISEQEKSMGKHMMRMNEMERQVHNVKVANLDMAAENQRLVHSSKSKKEREREREREGTSFVNASMLSVLREKEEVERERDEERERSKQREREWEKEREREREREERREREREAEREREKRREKEREEERERERRRETEREMEKEREGQRERERKREKEREMDRQRERDKYIEKMKEMEVQHEKEKEKRKHEHSEEMNRLREQISFLESVKMESSAAMDGMMEKRAKAMAKVKEMEMKVNHLHLLLEEKDEQIHQLNEERRQFESILKELHFQLSEQARENSIRKKNSSIRYSNLSEGSYSSPSSNSSHNQMHTSTRSTLKSKSKSNPTAEELETSSDLPLPNPTVQFDQRQKLNDDQSTVTMNSNRLIHNNDSNHINHSFHNNHLNHNNDLINDNDSNQLHHQNFRSLSNTKSLPAISSSEFGDLVNELRKTMRRDDINTMNTHLYDSSDFVLTKDNMERGNKASIYGNTVEKGNDGMQVDDNQFNSNQSLNQISTQEQSIKSESDFIDLKRKEKREGGRRKENEGEFMMKRELSYEEEDASTPRLGPIRNWSSFSSQNLSGDELIHDNKLSKNESNNNKLNKANSLYFSDVDEEDNNKYNDDMDAEEQWKLLTQRIADEVMLSSPVKVHELSAKLERLASLQMEMEKEKGEKEKEEEEEKKGEKQEEMERRYDYEGWKLSNAKEEDIEGEEKKMKKIEKEKDSSRLSDKRFENENKNDARMNDKRNEFEFENIGQVREVGRGRGKHERKERKDDGREMDSRFKREGKDDEDSNNNKDNNDNNDINNNVVHDDGEDEEDNLNLNNCIDQRERLLNLKRRVDRLTHLTPLASDKENSQLDEESQRNEKSQSDGNEKEFSFQGRHILPEKNLKIFPSLQHNSEDKKSKSNQLDLMLTDFDLTSPYIPKSQKEEMKRMMMVMMEKKKDENDLSATKNCIAPFPSPSRPSPVFPSPFSLPSPSNPPVPSSLPSEIEYMNIEKKSKDTKHLKSFSLSVPSSSPPALTLASPSSVSIPLSSFSSPSSSFSTSSSLITETNLQKPLTNLKKSFSMNSGTELLETKEKDASSSPSSPPPPPSLSLSDSKKLTQSSLSLNSHFTKLQHHHSPSPSPSPPRFHPTMPFTPLSKSPEVNASQQVQIVENVLPRVKTIIPVQQSNSSDSQSQSQSPNNRKERPRMDYVNRKSPFQSPSFSPPLLSPLLSPSLLSPPLSPHHPKAGMHGYSEIESFKNMLSSSKKGVEEGKKEKKVSAMDSIFTLSDKSNSESLGKVGDAFPSLQTYTDSLTLNTLPEKEVRSMPKHERSFSENTVNSSDWENSSWTIKDEVARLEVELEAMDAQTELGVMMSPSPSPSPSRMMSPVRLDYGRSDEGEGGEEAVYSNTFSSSSSRSSPGLKVQSKLNGEEESVRNLRKERVWREEHEEGMVEESHDRESEDEEDEEDYEVEDGDENREASDEVLNEMLDTMVDDMFKVCSK